MVQRVFVKVVGFSAMERHALNTVFRLSEERETAYALWMPGAPGPARLVLIDGGTPQAAAEVPPANGQEPMLGWVGADAPVHTWRVFERPLAWHEVVAAMDELFVAPQPDVDFDLGPDNGAADTLPPEPEEARPRALIASADRDQRLYLRARLALAGFTTVDEAQSAAEALDLQRLLTYCVALVEHGPPAVDGWALLKALHASPRHRPQVILLKTGGSVLDRVRAWLAGADAFLANPPEPFTLQRVLNKVGAKAPSPSQHAVAAQ